jgi:asparagine synthetase B (glutamine-hydrolysing)
MGGICGSTDDSRRTRVAGMNAVIASRGPQAVRAFTDYLSGVSLGAGRPVSNEDGTVWAALEGEVNNHSALHEALRRRGHRFASGVDTELLVHLYEEHGAAMVDQLEGMYAFALWDARREELLVGRDRFGEKPLFYAERHGELDFASELDALLAGIGRVPDLDPGVSQLPPGHLLRWRRSSRRVQVDRYSLSDPGWTGCETGPEPNSHLPI